MRREVKPPLTLTAALAVITIVNRHIDRMLELGPKADKTPSWKINSPIYWYHRYSDMVKRVFQQYDACDFKVFGEQAFTNALVLQPPQYSLHFAAQLHRDQMYELEQRLKRTSFR